MSDSQNELYEYFLIEAPELLQTIEATLLSLMEEKTIEKVHTLMRSAHTLKGSAASVEESTIQTIAHHLEDVFEALYPEELEIDGELGGLLLDGYDCLREPLSATLADVNYDCDAVLEKTAAIFAQLQDKLGDFFGREAFLPTSEELGFDVVESIFADSIIQDLELLETTIVGQNPLEIEEVLKSQAEFFSDLGITYDLPGLAAIAKITLAAIEQNPEQINDIAIAALSNFHQARADILEGDRQQGGKVSAELSNLLGETAIDEDLGFDLEAEEGKSENEFFDESFFDDSEDNGEMTMAFMPQIIPESQTEIQSANLEVKSNTFTESDRETELPDRDDFSDLYDSDLEYDTDKEFFDDSFFEDSLDDDAEMTMAFSPEIVADSALVNFTANSEVEADILKEEPAILEEFATLDSEINDIQLNANYYVPAKSPVEEILQSITTLNLPSIYTDGRNPLEIRKSATHKPSDKMLPSIKVPIEQLDRLNHTVGELFIKENQQNLQQDKLQLLLKETFQEFRRCQLELSRLGDLSEQQKRDYKRQQRKYRHQQKLGIATNCPQTVSNLPVVTSNKRKSLANKTHLFSGVSSQNQDFLAEFDALEMDVYSNFDLKLQAIAENMTQLGNKIEAIDRIVGQSSLDINKRKQLLNLAQSELLQARMLPLSTVFNRFPRQVQQMVSSYQKPAKFKTMGGEVTIDKAITEKLYEPLLHLVRNAYDHGLENPEIRQQKGKSDVGKITIRAYNRGNRTIIEIQDDGKGIDLEKVVNKAIEKNLLKPSQLDTISEKEITDFLFQPGFSTASQVTDLSGRGVGLNVVKSQIKALDGSISIRSNQGEGTTFTLQLPLNITTARLLLCESQGIIYGILSTEIKKVMNPNLEQIKHRPSLTSDVPESFWRYQKGDRVELVPICELNNIIDYSYPIMPRQSSLLDTLIGKKEKLQNKSLLLVEAEGKQLCLAVERILTEKELVIKSLNSLTVLPSYLQGYSVLGDGSLALVINPVELVTKTYSKSNLKSREKAISSLNLSPAVSNPIETKSLPYQKPTVLVVEDSIVQRQSLARMLERGGYEIFQASNGQEAIAILEKKSQIKLILSDVEMPVMNGFEFLIYCQSDINFSQIPVIMITTRSGQKHRALALSLGAKHYLIKPANERKLLKLAAELIVSNQSK